MWWGILNIFLLNLRGKNPQIKGRNYRYVVRPQWVLPSSSLSFPGGFSETEDFLTWQVALHRLEKHKKVLRILGYITDSGKRALNCLFFRGVGLTKFTGTAASISFKVRKVGTFGHMLIVTTRQWGWYVRPWYYLCLLVPASVTLWTLPHFHLPLFSWFQYIQYTEVQSEKKEPKVELKNNHIIEQRNPCKDHGSWFHTWSGGKLSLWFLSLLSRHPCRTAVPQ